MGTALGILTILGVILVILAITINFRKEENGYCMLSFGIGIIFSIMVLGTIYALSIHPIDVYRGKTVLQITYEDSIPIDSIVVYKNK